ncbi:MAG TPA: MBL fold metallo-hydrolase [Solirubrobacteraceae bacterium]|nr:MBL fold metallo-hydrolase [Solirubrobacteraceae bacterium]
MAEARTIDVDLAALTREDGTLRTVLAWGDPVSVVDEDASRVKVETTRYVEQGDGSIVPRPETGFVKRRAGRRLVTVPAAGSRVLKVDFVDVQQGDGTLIETPEGRLLTVDGGDNQLFARYLAARYPGTTAEAPLGIDAMVVSHGDADHFAGLEEMHRSEARTDELLKRVFVQPSRVFHNGLVKRPSSVAGSKQLGPTRKVGGETLHTGLESDLLAVPDQELNAPFKTWKRALKAWNARRPIDFRRLAQGDHDAFDFLRDEGIDVQVLAPIVTERGGVTGLRSLGDPSHTINGHSIVLRLAFGRWRLLLAGDLNTPAEESLTADHEAGRLDLRSDVFKVPHHGSAEFSAPFLAAVSPVVAVVSSGDESARKEYMHPRATLMSALGRHSRDPAPVVFVTELVAFFEQVGWVKPRTVNGKAPKGRDRDFYAFRRTAYGLVRVRTDGERLLVYTNSGQARLKEAYAYTAAPSGEVAPAELVRA